MQLTKDQQTHEGVRINGSASLCMWGSGVVQILRKLGDGPYLPMTDSAGEELILEGAGPEGVLYNADIYNTCPQAQFAFKLVDGGPINFNLAG